MANALSDLINSGQFAEGLQRPSQNAFGRWVQGVAQRTMNPLATLAAEADRYRNMPTEELLGQFGPSGGSLAGLVGHTAWHGSPHMFDAFKKEAIGTGEGAQAYGHGLYLAESPEVATGYRGRLSTNYLGSKGEQIPSGEVWTNAKDAVKQASDMHPDRARAIASHIQDYVDSGSKAEDYFKEFDVPASLRPAYQAAIDKFSGITPNPGALYKTDIPDAHIDKMLDWHAPLSEQSPYVQGALAKAGMVGDSVTGRQELFNQFDAGKITKQQLNDGIEALGSRQPATALGQELYMRLGNQEKASKALSDAGITGIKYLDGFSRGAQGGEGTRNFVIFNPEDIRILERNAQPTGQAPWSDTNRLSQIAGNK